MKNLSTQIAVTVPVALVVVAAVLWTYDRQVVRPRQVLGFVDVAEVYRLKEAQFTQTITRAPSAEIGRERAMLIAQDFARRLPIVLQELPYECDCLVVVKGALASQSDRTIDLTATVKKRLGLP